MMKMNLDQSQVEEVLQFIDKNRQRFIDSGRKFWGMPELGYEEFQTSGYAIEQLEASDYHVRKGLSITGFRADLDTGRPGPTVALFGEMDALYVPAHPEAKDGRVHACGHHTHINTLVGTAWVLKHSPILKDMCGKIAFIGTPDEESSNVDLARKYIEEGKLKAISGKISLYRQGVLDDVDLGFMNHCGSLKALYCRLNSGNIKKRIVFHGKSCHAGWPHQGNNAMNQMTLAQCAIGLLRERMTEGMRVHGIVLDGGAALNVIPDRAELSYCIRGRTIEEMVTCSRMFDQAMHHCAQALGGECDITTIQGSLPVKAAPELGKIYGTVMNKLMPECQAPERFVTRAGCSDMGDISTVMPALHGSAPGLVGTGHGADARTPDDELAYVMPIKQAVLMLYLLLSNDAEEAKKTIAEFGPKLTHEQYEAIQHSMQN